MNRKNVIRTLSAIAVILLLGWSFFYFSDDTRGFKPVDTSVAMAQINADNVKSAQIDDREQQLRLEPGSGGNHFLLVRLRRQELNELDPEIGIILQIHDHEVGFELPQCCDVLLTELREPHRRFQSERHRELRRKYVTLAILWEEYIAGEPGENGLQLARDVGSHHVLHVFLPQATQLPVGVFRDQHRYRRNSLFRDPVILEHAEIERRISDGTVGHPPRSSRATSRRCRGTTFAPCGGRTPGWRRWG